MTQLFFENYRLSILANGYDSSLKLYTIDEVVNHKFIHEFKAPKGDQFPILVKIVYKDNKKMTLESKANITVKVFLNDKLALKETQSSFIVTVFTDLLYMN